MRQPDKHRFLNAVRHIEPAQVPLVETDPDMEIVNLLLGTDFPRSLHAYELPVRDNVGLNLRMGNDLLYFADIWRLGRKDVTDAAGRINYVDGTMKTPEALEKLWFPDLGEVERRLEETLRAIDGTGLGLLCSNKFAPAIVSTAVGIADYWVAIMDSSGFIHEFQQRVHEHCLRELALFARYRVDAINLGLNIGMKSGPICSPAVLEEFQYPLLREQIRAAKEHGIVVRLHVDGNAVPLIPDFIAMGADLLNPLEPCDGLQDIYEVKRQFGDRIALHGNIDIAGVLTGGTPEDVERDVLEHLERLAPGGGYVVGSSHNLSADVPLRNYCAMRDAVHNYTLRRN